ncbi:hypothetical protein HanOQP8_Chr17g0665161 [Helianthus annuus]|nr:hypothetical protein HanOQP8_Chr17g0665161 [Helianthus annuus]
MWINKDPPRGFPFSTPQPEKNRTYSSPPYAHRPRPPPVTEKKWTAALSNPSNHLFHIIHKVPAGDSPYVRAKHVQLVENNPTKAVSLFWAAINSGDRIDSALKDMAVVMKQLNRSDEAIEAIKSFRYLCEWESQESLDNILLELFKVKLVFPNPFCGKRLEKCMIFASVYRGRGGLTSRLNYFNRKLLIWRRTL